MLPALARLGGFALKYGRMALIGLGLVKVGNDLDPTDTDDNNKVGGFWVVVGFLMAAGLVYLGIKKKK